MQRFRSSCLILLLSLLTLPTLASTTNAPTLASLNPNARQIFLVTMHWGDRCWDPQSKLLHDSPNGQPTVRSSSSYALGLLLRDEPGDRTRAAEVLNAVLAQQYNAPGEPYDGTFRRNLSEPNAQPGAVIWKDYDPNWREFIGTTFAIILEEFPNKIPPRLDRSLNASIVHAVSGEIGNKRLVPTYTNPALMYGFLWNFAATRNHRTDWIAESKAWQSSAYSLFKKHDAFNEYNSPTYSGVDLYALGLWRCYGATSRIRQMGRDMEQSLWKSLAAFYNANLKNISGPFDRAYGMDMTSYVSVVGVALRFTLDASRAPLPEQAPPATHGGDLWFAPHFAILGSDIPPDAMRSFRSFQRPRLVKRQITGRRVAEAWIGKSVMYGGEITGNSRGISGESQFHAATVQWRTPGGQIGWIQLTKTPPVNASADKHGLVISCSGDVTFRIHAQGIDSARIKPPEWNLPGLTVYVAADATQFLVNRGTDEVEVKYSHITRMKLKIDLATHGGDTRSQRALWGY